MRASVGGVLDTSIRDQLPLVVADGITKGLSMVMIVRLCTSAGARKVPEDHMRVRDALSAV